MISMFCDSNCLKVDFELFYQPGLATEMLSEGGRIELKEKLVSFVSIFSPSHKATGVSSRCLVPFLD